MANKPATAIAFGVIVVGVGIHKTLNATRQRLITALFMYDLGPGLCVVFEMLVSTPCVPEVKRL